MRPLLLARLGGVGELVPLGDALHHARHVLRLREGEPVRVTDGRGLRALGRIEAEGVRIEAIEAVNEPVVEVLLGLPRAALVEEALTLGTEAGVTVFRLVTAERTPPGRVREERLARVIDAAVTQCGRATRPRLVGPSSLGEAIARAAEGRRVFGRQGAPGLERGEGALIAAIGPEGGWTEREEAELSAAGFRAVGLGPHVLRAPTAVLAVVVRGSGC